MANCHPCGVERRCSRPVRAAPTVREVCEPPSRLPSAPSQACGDSDAAGLDGGGCFGNESSLVCKRTTKAEAAFGALLLLRRRSNQSAINY